MNRNQKILSSVIILAIIAFSATGAQADVTGLTSGTLHIAGSSTVGPIALAEADQFPAYWNSLVAANPSWGASPVSTFNIETQGSGTAIPGLLAGADIGEMSRPPKSSGTSEWGNPVMSNMQIWAVGIDSVAVVVSPDMTWFPTNLNTLQVAKLFARSSSGGNPYYTTWGDFLADYYGGAANIPSSVPAAARTANINRAVRDLGSGTADCFNIYFGTANNYNLLDNNVLAPYTYCQENINIYNTVHTGNLAANTEYIGFISLGYLQTYGNMIGLNIAFNMHNAPWSTQNYDSTTVWGPYVAPTRANVIYGYSNVQGTSATGQYSAWRWLWEVTPSTIPTTGPLLETGVWIAYMMKDGTTNNGNSMFVLDKSYIELSRADMAGGQVLDSNLAAYTPLPGQTQTIPDGKVNYQDFFYFADAYIHYYNSGTYNPYADINADGVINYSDFFGFVGAYVAYYQVYNPTH